MGSERALAEGIWGIRVDSNSCECVVEGSKGPRGVVNFGYLGRASRGRERAVGWLGSVCIPSQGVGERGQWAFGGIREGAGEGLSGLREGWGRLGFVCIPSQGVGERGQWAFGGIREGVGEGLSRPREGWGRLGSMCIPSQGVGKRGQWAFGGIREGAGEGLSGPREGWRRLESVCIPSQGVGERGQWAFGGIREGAGEGLSGPREGCGPVGVCVHSFTGRGRERAAGAWWDQRGRWRRAFGVLGLIPILVSAWLRAARGQEVWSTLGTWGGPLGAERGLWSGWGLCAFLHRAWARGGSGPLVGSGRALGRACWGRERAEWSLGGNQSYFGFCSPENVWSPNSCMCYCSVGRGARYGGCGFHRGGVRGRSEGTSMLLSL